MATQPVTSIGGFVPRGAPPLPSRTPVPLAPTGRLHLAAPGTAQRRIAQLQPVAPPAPAKHRSIGAQIGGVFGGLIPGAIHMATGAAKNLVGAPRIAIDIARGDLSARDALSLASPTNIFHGGTPKMQALEHRYFPLTNEVVGSAEQTAGRLAQLTPVETASVGGHHVETYGDALRHGDIVGALLNDATNVSMAGSLAGHALGAGAGLAAGAGAAETAARLGKAADVADTVGRLGGRAANAPLEAVGGVLKGGKSLLRAGIEAGEEGLFKRLPKEGHLGSRLSMRGTPEGVVTREAMRESMSEPLARAAHMEENLAKDAGLLEKDAALRPSLVEQEVGLTRVAGVAQAHQLVARWLGDTKAYEAHMGGQRVEPGRTLTPEGARMNAEYQAGTLPPEQMARIDRVSEAARKHSAIASEAALAGEGALKGPMDPAYMGHEPLDEQVQRRLAENMDPKELAALETARKDMGRRERMDQPDFDSSANYPPVDWPRFQRAIEGTPTGDLLHEILLDPDVYPARWREAMHVTAKGAEAGAPLMPRTPEQLMTAGIDPAYLPTTESMFGRPESPRTSPTTTGVASGLRGVASERHSATRGHGPYSLATLAEGLGRGIRTRTFNQTLMDYANNADIPTVATKIDQTTLDAIRTEAENVVDASSVGKLNKANRAAEIQEEFGRGVIEELAHRGYEVLHGNKNEPRFGDFDPSTAPKLNEVGPDSIVLPTGMKDRMVQHRTGKTTNPILAANQKVNSAFKRNVLGFNLHWTLGDAISNNIMSWVAGGVSPVALAESMIKVKNLDPAVFDQMFNRPDFTATGLRYEAAGALSPLGPLDRAAPRTTIGRGVRAIQNAQFKGNRVVNAIQREGFVLEKLERELKAKGLDSTSAMGTDAAKWAEPRVQKSISDAINSANKTFGTLDEMSPFEQRVMTQIFPFWSWTRHITSLAARTAIDNPARMLWTLRLGEIGMNTSPDDMPDFMRGSIGNPFGGKSRINLNWANPMYDVGSGGLSSAGSAFRQLSPLIKLGATAVANRDLSRNANITTHRPGTDPSRLATLLYQTAGMSPISRGLMNEAPQATLPGGIGLGPVRRYGSGQAIIDKTTGDAAPAQAGRLQAAANVVNLPFVPTDYVPTGASPARVPARRKSGLRRSGLTGRLHPTGLHG